MIQATFRADASETQIRVLLAKIGVLTGSLVVEQIFGLPGIGKYFITAALDRDYGLVLGTTILYMAIILVLNLLVDLLYAWLDPRVRYR